jgi:hypothetical protein
MGSIRRNMHVRCSPDEAWKLVGNPGRLHEWFPMESCRVEGNKRWVTLPSQLVLEEDIVLHDHDLHRFQYKIVNNFLITEHLSTLDVIDDGHGHCIIIYSTEVKPDVFALVIGGAAGEALENARRILERA